MPLSCGLGKTTVHTARQNGQKKRPEEFPILAVPNVILKLYSVVALTIKEARNVQPAGIFLFFFIFVIATGQTTRKI